MRFLITFIATAVFVPLLMLKKAFEINVRHHQIELSNLPNQNPFRVFFISDIHRRKISNHLINQIGTGIEAVIIGGDLAERGVSLKKVEENINRLAKIGPLYYVWGNNDREVGEEHIRQYILNVGGIILENEAICVNNQGEPIWIVGIDDVSSGRADIPKSFAFVPENDTIIFVSHTPFVFNNVKEHFNPNLLLAGHTHGGQIRLGKWGYYQKGSLRYGQKDVTLISNGFGTTLIPMRLGAPAECHVLTLKKKVPANY